MFQLKQMHRPKYLSQPSTKQNLFLGDYRFLRFKDKMKNYKGIIVFQSKKDYSKDTR